MRSVLPSLIPAALAFALSYLRPPELLLGALSAVALLWMPGRGFARHLRDDPLARASLGFWLSCALTAFGVVLGAWTGAGARGTLLWSAALTALGYALPARRPTPLAAGPYLGAWTVVAAVAALAWTWRGTLVRPLDAHWWSADVEDGAFSGSPPADTIAFARGRVGDALRLDPRKPVAGLLGPMEGTVLVALRGPVGATARIGEDLTLRVDAAPVVRADEGPVPRYLDRGVASARLTRTLAAGERLEVRFSDPDASTLWIFPNAEAVWDTHGAGRLRHAHYYQLLNMEEQVRWARELYGERRVTDVQPPLGAYVAAGPLGLTRGDLPTQNAVLLVVLLACGLGAVSCVRAWAPSAPLLAWPLPGLAVAAHARLLLEPGSSGMPDSLYAAALSLAFAGLARPNDARFGAGALLAQLARYPGAPLAALAGVLAGQPRRAARMFAGVLGVAAVFGLYGLLAGQLSGWLDTVAWETGPEHWHGDHDPTRLLGRVPGFFGLWLGYAGATPLLAALRWPRGTAVVLGAAVPYAVLLGTVDHAPSHYFVPLVHLGAVALAISADAWTSPWVRVALPLLGACGFAWSLAAFPVTG